MNKFKAGGLAYNINSGNLVETLKKEFSSISVKYRLYGLDIEYLTENFELYINSFDEKEYFISILFAGEELELIKWLKKIVQVLESQTNDFDMGYYTIDSDGNQKSDDIYLKRFTPPLRLGIIQVFFFIRVLIVL